MKDGSVFERRYPVSVTEKALKDKIQLHLN